MFIHRYTMYLTQYCWRWRTVLYPVARWVWSTSVMQMDANLPHKFIYFEHKLTSSPLSNPVACQLFYSTFLAKNSLTSLYQKITFESVQKFLFLTNLFLISRWSQHKKALWVAQSLYEHLFIFTWRDWCTPHMYSRALWGTVLAVYTWERMVTRN